MNCRRSFACLALALLMTVSMVACGGENDTAWQPEPQDGGESQRNASSAPPVSPSGPADPMDFSTANIDWRRFEGEELRLLLLQHGSTAVVEPRLDEFTALTGITVTIETLPESDYNNKLLVEFNSGANPPDVFMTANPTVFADGGWFEDLNQYVNNPTLTDPDFYRFDDFFPSAIEYSTFRDVLYGIPFTGEWQMMYYRKDWFEELGLEVPADFDELRAVCEALTDKDNNRYGIVARLKKGIGADVIYNNFLSAWGGEFMQDRDGGLICMLDSDAAIESMDYYMGLLRDYGPPGQVNYGWSEAISEMQSGTTGIFIDATNFIGQLDDPEESTVAGLLGYAPVPRMNGQDSPLHFSHWTFSLCSLGDKKEAAWYFVQWVTSTPMILDCGLDMGAASRLSLFENQVFIDRYGEEYIEAALAGAQRGYRLYGQRFAEWSPSRDPLVAGMQEIYGGADASQTMVRVTAEIQEIYKGVTP